MDLRQYPEGRIGYVLDDQFVEVRLDHDQLRTLRAKPVVIIKSFGDLIIMPTYALMIQDTSRGAYTGMTAFANLSLAYGPTGALGTAAQWQMDQSLNAIAQQAMQAGILFLPSVTKAIGQNQPMVLHNDDDHELAGGHALNIVRFVIGFKVLRGW